MSEGLHEAAHVRTRKIIKIDSMTVLVQCLQPADLDDAYATIVITKNATLDDWNWGDDC